MRAMSMAMPAGAAMATMVQGSGGLGGLRALGPHSFGSSPSRTKPVATEGSEAA